MFKGITCPTSSWPAPSNGELSYLCRLQSRVESGTTCFATCNHGYQLKGPSSSRCGDDGNWSPQLSPNCEGKNKKDKNVRKSRFHFVKFENTFVVSWTWAPLPGTQNHRTITEVTFCFSVRKCSPQPLPDKGDITPPICKTQPLHGQTCYYECPGYTLDGPSSSTCDNGDWTQSGFHCRGKKLLKTLKWRTSRLFVSVVFSTS